ncbi:hypothetical protein HYV70_00530 [Candidatus Uhrbacteria bacterium]|nr:hypothetical protein [Candidatus Uhrbacteria bacterium]
MFLVICAQDIQNISFGIVEEGCLIKQKQFVSSFPEDYLLLLNDTLGEWGMKDHEQEFEGVIVVTGPGSFTASRVSTTIANGFAFTRSIPVIGLSNPQRLDLASLLSVNRSTNLGADFVLPTYNRPPNITAQKIGNS